MSEWISVDECERGMYTMLAAVLRVRWLVRLGAKE